MSEWTNDWITNSWILNKQQPISKWMLKWGNRHLGVCADVSVLPSSLKGLPVLWGAILFVDTEEFDR